MSITHLLSYIALNSPGPTEMVALLAGGVMVFAALLASIDYVMGRHY